MMSGRVKYTSCPWLVWVIIISEVHCRLHYFSYVAIFVVVVSYFIDFCIRIPPAISNAHTQAHKHNGHYYQNQQCNSARLLALTSSTHFMISVQAKKLSFFMNHDRAPHFYSTLHFPAIPKEKFQENHTQSLDHLKRRVLMVSHLQSFKFCIYIYSKVKFRFVFLPIFISCVSSFVLVQVLHFFNIGLYQVIISVVVFLFFSMVKNVLSSNHPFLY